MRVASLLRLSSKRQVQRQSNDEKDIPAQRETIARFLADRPDWSLTKEYVEAGVSAFKKTRAQRDVLNDALRDAEEGKFDVLLVWKGDRLSRRIRDFPSIVEDFTECGVEVWSVVDEPGGKKWNARNALDFLMLSLEGFKNQSESENISIRTKERKRQIAQSGEWGGSKIPYGYVLVADKDDKGEPVTRGGRMVRHLIPGESAVIIREMFRLYITGKGYYHIARDLNEKSISSPSGGQWYTQTVRRILVNPFYAGYQNHRSVRGVVKGKHEPIIDEGTWLQAVETTKARSELPRRQRNGDYALTGNLYCGDCGFPMGGTRVVWVGRKGKRYPHRIYRCRSFMKGLSCHKTKTICDEAESSFLNAMMSERMPSHLKNYFEMRSTDGNQKLADYHAVMKSTKDRLAKVDETLTTLTKEYLEHATYTREEYVQLKAKYSSEKEGLEERLKEPPPNVKIVDVSAYVEAVENFPLTWQEATPEERKQLVMSFCHAFGIRLYLHRDGTIELRHV